MRKRHSPEFKAQVVQELLKEQKTVSQLAAEYGVHPNQLYRWRAIAMTEEGFSPPQAAGMQPRR